MKTLLRASALFLLLLLSLLPIDACAEGFAFDASGRITEQVICLDLKKDYLLNPGAGSMSFPRWTNRLYLYENVTVSYKNARFVGRVRPTLQSTPGGYSEGDFLTDDAYVEMRFQDRYFAYTGKRNIREGVAYGANPVDFLGEKKKVDWTLREEERRVEREGNYLAGLDLFFRNATLTAIFAPHLSGNQQEEDRLLLKAAFLLERIKTDATLLYYYGDKPGAGLAVSTTAGHSLVLYTESALRWNEGRGKIRMISAGTPRTYALVDPGDDSGTYLNLVVGGQYTFDNKVNIIGEYIYNGEGYDACDWRNYIDFVKYAHVNREKGFVSGLMLSYLGQANSITTFGQMRRNYLFARINKPDIGGKVDGSLVFVANLDDRSCLLSPSLVYRLNDRVALTASAQFFIGNKDIEYGMIPWQNAVSAGISVLF
ncbi:MAG: hypothetical protein GXY80_11985 [Syntrophorhabdus aromaticivorans]|uniref:Alginate export domain-containing protein n=1 Tax=Syntrophorhabdus aromaticivorans TaxID=328301 RepID=A0A971M530_9BACT|nr:hypothetical protein [Syntrophorhabdus aromaticivorans]